MITFVIGIVKLRGVCCRSRGEVDQFFGGDEFFASTEVALILSMVVDVNDSSWLLADCLNVCNRLITNVSIFS